MKVLILNGNPKIEYKEFDLYVKDLKHSLESKEHETKLIMLRSFQLHDCIGCYTCWLKTPGICCFNDGIDEIIKEYLAADIVIYASPVIMNYISALLKRVNDRMLPVVHPFLTLKEDRMTHLSRYSHYPKSVFLLDKPGSSDGGSSDFIERIYRSSQRDVPKILNTKQDVEEICNEIINY
ncbi:MAG: flavodoxin family protein [Bacillota bacterium]